MVVVAGDKHYSPQELLVVMVMKMMSSSNSKHKNRLRSKMRRLVPRTFQPVFGR